MIDLIGEIAGAEGAAPARIALARLLAQRPWIVPIPGAADVEPTGDDLARIEQALATVEVQSDRYPASLQGRVGR